MRSRFMVVSAFFRLLMEKLCNVISSVIDILLYLLTPNIFLLYFKYPVKFCHFYSSPALVVLSGWSHFFFSVYIPCIPTITFFKVVLYLDSIQTNYLSQEVSSKATMPSLLHNIFGASYLFLTLLSFIYKHFKWQSL